MTPGAYATREHSSTHAYRRAKERLQLPDTFNFDRFFDCVLRRIRRGDAKCLKLGRDGRLIYEVTEASTLYPGMVRVVVNAEKTFVISVVPLISNAERGKALLEAKGKRTRDFYRGLRIDEEGDNEDQMD
jgi:hypothetical protein